MLGCPEVKEEAVAAAVVLVAQLVALVAPEVADRRAVSHLLQIWETVLVVMEELAQAEAIMLVIMEEMAVLVATAATEVEQQVFV
jgi:hypothetical protein